MKNREKPIDLKKILKRSPEEIERDRRIFADARERLKHFVPQSDAEAAYQFALSREQTLEPIYKAYKYLPFNSDDERRQFDVLCNQLAECYALQARFFKAARLHGSAQHRAEYLEKGKAVRNRKLVHDCPQTKTETRGVSARAVVVTNRQQLERIFLPRENREVTISRCLVCQELFAEYAT